ncbi:MAG: EamA family transporter [bacterium]|nr:EamA family transporter [bacterium]
MNLIVYLILCLIWGSTWIAIKLGLSDAPPLWAASIRFIIAVLILGTIVLMKRYPLPKSWREYLRMGHPGIYMYGASYALIYFGELYINSALASVLFGSFPFFVAMLSYYSLPGEKKTSMLGWLGMLVGFIGVVLISYDSLQTSSHLFLGTMLTLLGSFVSAVGLMFHKRHCAETNIYVAAVVQMLFGGILLVVSALIFEDITALKISATSIGSILYLAIFGTAVAFIGYYWLLTKMRTVTVSLIGFVTPLVAILIGVYMFDEQLSLLVLVGAALILSGIALVVKK